MDFKRLMALTFQKVKEHKSDVIDTAPATA